MPAYEYAVCEERTGREIGCQVTALLPVDERDGLAVRGLTVYRISTGEMVETLPIGCNPRVAYKLQREQLPRRFNVSGSALNPTLERNGVVSGLYREEQRLGNDFERMAGFSKKQLAQVWAD